jgi:hypothetical protein
MEALTNIKVLHQIHGCKTLSALNSSKQPVLCKQLSFQNSTSAAKGLEYYHIAQAYLAECTHIVPLTDVFLCGETGLCAVFEFMEGSLQEEMARRRADGRTWTEAEVSDLVLPLIHELAYLESVKLMVSAAHPAKIFMHRGQFFLGKVSYPLYDVQKAKTWLSTPAVRRFCAPEFPELLRNRGPTLFQILTQNCVFCLGLTVYCMLTSTPPDQIDINIPQIQQTINSFPISKPLCDLLHRMLALQGPMRANFTALKWRIPTELSSSDVQLRIGLNEMTLKGIRSLEQLKEEVQKGLQSESFVLVDVRKNEVTMTGFDAMMRAQSCWVEVLQDPHR